MSLKTPLRAAILLLVAIAAAPAAADDSDKSGPDKTDKRACTEAYEAAQLHRQNFEYRAARKELDRCVNRSCPAFIQADCASWLNDLNDAIPSIVIVARDEAAEVFDVKVSIDGVPVLAALDGRELDVDPGKHTLRFEHGQYPPVEQTVIVRAGEKRRSISAQFVSAAAPASASPPPPAVESRPRRRPMPVTVYALSAVGVLGAASFTYFGIDGKKKLSDLRTTCSPFCTDEDVQPAKRSLLIADISLGVGVVALSAAAYFFLTRPSEVVTSGTSIAPELRVAHDGGFAGVRGAF